MHLCVCVMCVMYACVLYVCVMCVCVSCVCVMCYPYWHSPVSSSHRPFSSWHVQFRSRRGGGDDRHRTACQNSCQNRTGPHVRTHVRTSLCSAHGPPHYLSLAHMLISVHKGFSVGQGRIGSEPRFGLETCSILISRNTHLTHLLMTLNDHPN